MKTKKEFTFIGLSIDRNSGEPVYRQLYRVFRRAILEGRLRPGQQLPPSRELAAQLGVSRSTILLAFENLLTEGYVSGRTGSGTFVSATLPEKTLITSDLPGSGPQSPPARLSRRGVALAALPMGLRLDPINLRPFRTGIPALREFPFELWSRLLSQESRQLSFNDYGYREPGGYLPLREAIADHLRRVRALRCEAGQVIITSGAQQGLDLACRLLLDPGDSAWVEDPGYNGAKEALTGAGAHLSPVPVDEEGLVVSRGIASSPRARLVYITPSHQYPLGVTMSLSRRLELLEWAAKSGAYILEDDYDSDYRYGGRPLASLQGIDRNDRVIYLGTFSKVLFPGLRLGYVVTPPSLTDAFMAAKAFTDRHCPVLEQAALARFITEGHFSRHLRRMRLLYQERQEVLISAVDQHIGNDRLRVAPSDTGLHLVGWLPPKTDERQTADALMKAGVFAGPLSTYTLEHTRQPGFLLGYSPFHTEEIQRAVIKMSGILK